MPEEIVEQPEGQVPVDPAVAAIIARNTGSQVEAPPAVEQPKGQVEGEVEGGEQPPTYEITQDDFDVITKELGYTPEDLDEFEPDDIQNIIQTKTKKPEVVEEHAGKPVDADVTITPEMAEKYGGIAKSFIGKSLGELFTAMNKNNSYVTKLTSELDKYKKQLTTTEKSKVEELEAKLKTSTDLTEEDLWKGVDELVELKVQAKIRAAEPNPDEATKQAEFFQHIQTIIPEGMEAEKVSEEWWKSLDVEEQKAFSATSPIIVARAIKDFAGSKVKDAVVKKKDEQIEASEKDATKKARTLAAQLAKEAIQKSKGQPVAGSKYNVVNRGAPKPEWEDPTVAALMKRKLED
jgi:hypothetical protein